MRISRRKRNHMMGVAEYMYDRATDYGLDPGEMYALGLLHDIGYIYGRKGHEDSGYEILKSMGLCDELLFAVKAHGRDAWKVAAFVNDIPSAYVLLLEADMSVNSNGYNVGFAERIREIHERYGAAETGEHNVDFICCWCRDHGIRLPGNVTETGTGFAVLSGPART